MSRRGKGGQSIGRSLIWLIVELGGIGLLVTALPKLPLSGNSAGLPVRMEAADQAPRLTAQPSNLALPPLLPESVDFPELDLATNRWVVEATTATPAPGSFDPPPFTADPARDQQFVQRKLDDAGQKLLSGVSFYIHQAAKQVLNVPDDSGR